MNDQNLIYGPIRAKLSFTKKQAKNRIHNVQFSPQCSYCHLPIWKENVLWNSVRTICHCVYVFVNKRTATTCSFLRCYHFAYFVSYKKCDDVQSWRVFFSIGCSCRLFKIKRCSKTIKSLLFPTKVKDGNRERILHKGLYSYITKFIIWPYPKKAQCHLFNLHR